MQVTSSRSIGSSSQRSSPDVTCKFVVGDDRCEEGLCKIPLTQGFFAIVDSEDFERISHYNWCASVRSFPSGKRIYAIRDNKGMSEQMSYEILQVKRKKGRIIDHKNGDTLDYRKTNLRVCTQSGNRKNSRKQINCTSKYKGVHWRKNRKVWIATIQFKDRKKRKQLLYTRCEICAARAYDKAAEEHFGEFACLNNPPSCSC